MCPRIVDKDLKKQDILEASIRVFARLGIANTKMIDIAREAGIGKGTIYEYFRSKQEIIMAAFQDFMSKMDAAASDQLANVPDPVDKLSHIVDGWMNIVSEAYDEFRVLVDFWAHSLRMEEDMGEFDLRGIIQNYRTFLAGIIEEGIAGGTIKPMDAEVMASIIIAALDGLVLHWIIGRDSFDLHRAAELFKETTLGAMKKP